MIENKKKDAAESINVLDALIVLLRWKKVIVAVTGSAVLCTAIISLILPATYRAETTIMPPQPSSSGMAAQMLMTQLGGLGVDAVLSGVKTTNDLYVGLLKSRFILDRVIDRFSLMSAYKTKYREDARLKLLSDLNVENDKRSSIITVRVDYRDPKIAADMANAFVEELRHLGQNIAVTEASQRRLFFEEQLKNVRTSLMNAEDSLKGFQEKSGTIEIKEQAKAVIESIAHLRAQIAAKEVERSVLVTYATPANPDLQKVDEAIRGMKVQLGKLEGKGDQSDSFISTGRMPTAGINYMRRLRDLKYYETLFELLSKQYEMAKVDEARDATIIQVIDRAFPPERRNTPKRTNMVLIALFGGIFLSVGGVFFYELFKRLLQEPEVRAKMETLRKHALFRI